MTVADTPQSTAASPHELQSIIDLAWEGRASINTVNSPEIREAVETVIDDLNAGRIRVAERQAVGVPPPPAPLPDLLLRSSAPCP